MNKRALNLGICILLFIALAGIAHSASLADGSGNFFEGFEGAQGDNATNDGFDNAGWRLVNEGGTWTAHEKDEYAGAEALSVKNIGWLSWEEINVSTENYTNIIFSVYYRTQGAFEADDYLTVDYWNGTQWINVANTSNSPTYTLTNNTLGSDVSNNPNFMIRVGCDTDASNEYCMWDNVQIVGVEAFPPNVTDLAPAAGTEYNDYADVEIQANATDVSSVDTVLANITWNGGFKTVVMTDPNTDGRYNYTFSNVVKSGRNNITIVANDTHGNVNNTETTYFEINDTTPPRVLIIHPWGICEHNHHHDEYEEVDITLNVTDLTEVDAIIANVTDPNGTSYLLSNWGYGLQSDDFETDTEGTNWAHANVTSAGQTCFNDIDGTAPGKMFFAIDGGTGPSTTHCAYNSIERANGNFDLNLTFNITYMEDDSFFTLRSAPTDNLAGVGIRVYISVMKQAGGIIYRFAYNNGTDTTQQNIPNSETEGKLRIKRSNMTGTPFFNLYYLNSTDQKWIDVFGNTSLPGSSRTQYIQLKPGAEASNFGKINLTVDNFLISGDNLTFALFNQTSLSGRYNLSITANDTLGYVNDTETSYFNVSEVNDAPSRPFIEEPDINDAVKGLFNISWGKVFDEEGDNLQFNITLLNPNNGTNATIVSNYGNESNTWYEWNTSNHTEGPYGLKILVFENETTDKLSNSDTLGGNFTIDRSNPEVIIVYPLNDTLNANEDVAISLNITDISPIDTITANISAPNGSNYILTDFSTGLPSDDFTTDTEGINWLHKNTTFAGQTCLTDIDGTIPGKMFISVDGGTGPSTAHCAYNSLRRVDGNYDLNLTFNITYMEDDSFFTLRSAPTDSMAASGIRVYIAVMKQAGGIIYRFAYNNGTDTTQQNIPNSETEGKLRIKRSNMTGTPFFNLYYLNSTDQKWIDVFGNTSLPGSSRTQYIQLKPGAEASNFGKINLTVDNFLISGDNHQFTIFNQTEIDGLYNVSISVKDRANNINNTETTMFNIAAENTAPSRPFFEEPDVGDTVSGLFNISWGQVIDTEGDNVQFNITLLNPNNGTNATIVSNYGNASNTWYEWNTSNHTEGPYGLKILVFENETTERLSNSDTLSGNFTIDRTLPTVQLNHPGDEDIVSPSINFNWTATDNLDTTLLCNLTINGTVDAEDIASQNGTPTNYTVSGLSGGLHHWNVTCWDNAGNTNTSETRNFTVDATGPNCTVISATPADIEQNSTGTFEFIINCTDESGVNISRFFITRTMEDPESPGLPNHWSIRPPNNDKSNPDSYFTGESIFLADGRSLGDMWYNSLFSENYSYAVSAETMPSGANPYVDITCSADNITCQFNLSMPLEATVFRSSLFLSRGEMETEEKKEFGIDKASGVLIKFWNLEAEMGIANYTTTMFSNINYTGSPNKAMDVFFCNSSYNISAGISPHDDNVHCAYLDTFSEATLSNKDYSSRNSSYVKRVFSVTDSQIAGITATSTVYMFYDSHSSVGTYDIRYANGSSGTNVSFKDSKVAWTSTDDGANWTQAEFTPDIWFSQSKDGDQSQLGVYVEDLNGNDYTNFTFYTDNIGDVNFQISNPSIKAYQNFLNTNQSYHDHENEDLNGTYSEWMTIHVNTAHDPDAQGTVNHSLYLYNTDGTYNYTINNSFYSSDDSNIHIYFNTTLVPDGTYKMNITAVADDNANDIKSYLTEANFTIDNAPPNVTDVRPVAGADYNTSDVIEVSANVTDTTAVDSVIANVTYPNSTVEQLSLTNKTSDKYNSSYTIPDLDGRYNITIIANDTLNNINNTETSWFNVFTATVSFTLTLPGESPIVANETQNGTTATMFFNTSTNTNYDVDPCVLATGTCQNSTVPFFVFENTGNVNLSWTVNLNESLPTEITLQANDQYNGSNATDITTAPYNLSSAVPPSNQSNGFFFADYVNAYPANSTNVSLTHQGTDVES